MTKRLFARTGLSLERLRTFAEVVAAAGISQAAPGDSNRQSQFSRQLKELESFFGAELLRRGRGRFELTAAGNELFQIVQSHFNAMEDLIDRCADRSVEMRLGAGESLLYWLIPPCLQEFRTRRPLVTLVLQNLRTDDIVNRLMDGQLDAGLLRQDAVRTSLQSEPIGTMSYGLWVPDLLGLEIKRRDFWKFLKSTQVAVLEGGTVTSAFEEAGEAKGIRLKICFRGSSYPQMVEASKQLGCAALLPIFEGGPEIQGGTVYPIPTLKPFTRILALAWNPRFVSLRQEIERAIESFSTILRGRVVQGPFKGAR